LIKRLFETKTYNDEGIYRVSLYVTGRWQTITVDDYIPCHPKNGPFFASIGGSSSIWLNILEKAVAKVHGGYNYLKGGSALEGLRMLTGVPLTSFAFSDPTVLEMIYNESIKALIKDFLEKRSYVVVASTTPAGLFVQDSSSVKDSASAYTTQTQDFGQTLQTEGETPPPKGCSFSILGWKEQHGRFFVKLYDKSDLLINKGKYAPTSILWTPFLQHEFDYDPS